jgi:hypothetical protein
MGRHLHDNAALPLTGLRASVPGGSPIRRRSRSPARSPPAGTTAPSGGPRAGSSTTRSRTRDTDEAGVYVGNNPLTLRDPTGLWCIEAVGYSGVGGGAKLCHSDEGTSLCVEVGFGLGGSLGLDSGDMELPGSEIEAELKAKCGPIGAGGKCKFDECGLNCKPKGEIGPLKIEKDKAGINVRKISGAKAVLEGTKCSLGGKLAGRVCRAWRNYG